MQKQPECCVVSTCQRHVRVLTAITRDAWAGAEKKGLQWIPGGAVGGVCTLRSGRDWLERKAQCRGQPAELSDGEQVGVSNDAEEPAWTRKRRPGKPAL